MLKLKDSSVTTAGTKRELWFALGVSMAVFAGFGFDCCVTSLTDGSHNPGSLHPKGYAADIRIKNVVDSAGALNESIVSSIFDKISGLLRPHGFDVVYEGGVLSTPMTTGAHIHVEFQPKPGEAAVPAMEGNG